MLAGSPKFWKAPSRTSQEVRELKWLPHAVFPQANGRTSQEVRELKLDLNMTRQRVWQSHLARGA